MLRMPLDSPFIISLHRSLRMLTVRYATLPAACETTSMNQRLAHQKIDLWSQSHFLWPNLWSFLFLSFFLQASSSLLINAGLGKKMKKKRKCESAARADFIRFAFHTEWIHRSRKRWYASLSSRHHMWVHKYLIQACRYKFFELEVFRHRQKE